MNSATLLLLTSAIFMLFAMHDRKKADLLSSEISNLSALLPKTSIPALQSPPSQPAKSVAIPSSSSSTPAAAVANPSKLLSSVFSGFQSGKPMSMIDAPQKTHSRMELRIARGLVKDELANGLVLDCGGWVVKSATNGGL